MSAPRKQSDVAVAVRDPEKTKHLLLETAKKLFARKGLDGTTVKELADEAGVNISLISYHFGGKEGLYRSCLQQFGQQRLAVTEKLLTTPTSVEEFKVRLTIFVQQILEFNATDSDFTKMIHRECESEMTLTQDIFEQTFLKLFDTLSRFFQSAQKARLIDRKLDTHMVSGFLIGSLMQIAKTDALNQRYYKNSIQDPTYREEVAKNLVAMFLNGLLTREPQKGE